METIHISQFYSCSEVSCSSELYYLSELGKYLYLKHNKALSIDGVILTSDLKKSLYWDYFRLVVSKGWVVDTNLPSYEVDITSYNPINYDVDFKNFYMTLDPVTYDSVDNAKRQLAEYNYSTPKPTQVCFTERNDSVWFWTLKGTCSLEEITNSASLNTACASKAWVSLVAMVAVERLITGSPKKFCIEFPYVVAKNQLALADFMVLTDDTDAFTGWVLFSFEPSVSEDIQRQLGYEAWWFRGKEKGMLSGWYKPKDKLSYMKELDLGVGDIVLLYERDYSTKYNFVKFINSCHVAIIREITNSSVSFEIVNTVKTKFGAEQAYQNQTMAVKQMYCGSTKYKEWNSVNKSFDFIDLGIEYMMHTEEYFIVPLNQAEDILELEVTDGVRKDRFALYQNDAIYWILKDYNVDFNEDKFLSTYFKNTKTAYETYMSGGDLPSEWRID